MRLREKKEFIFMLASVNLLSLAVQAAWAQEPATSGTNGAVPNEVATGDTAKADVANVVKVTGFRKSYTDALAIKRQNIGVSDSISAEAMDNFPDLNVGEALQRIPGIQVNRDEDSRNASINLRGLPGSYAKMTLNGMDFASPTLSGSPPMGAFDSDIFSAFTVLKSISAAEQSGGISGNVDMQVAPALSRREGTSVKLSTEYNELGKYATPKATVSASRRYLDGRLGVFGVLAYKKEKFRRDSLYANQFTQLNPLTPDFLNRFKDYYASSCTGQPAPCVATPGGTGAISTAGVSIPSELRQVVRYNEGHLVSGVLGAEYKVTSKLRVGGSYLYSQRDNPRSTTQLLITDLRPNTTIVDPLAAPFRHTDGRYYVTDYRFVNPMLWTSNRGTPTTQNTAGLTLKATYNTDDWKIDLGTSLSNATNSYYENETDFRNRSKPITAASPLGNGLTGTVRLSQGIGNFYNSFDQTGPAVTQSQLGGIWTGTGQEIFNTNGDSMLLTGTDHYAHNKVKALRLDAERFLDWGPVESIQFGGQFNRNQSISRKLRSSANGLDLSKINANSPFIRQSEYISDFFGGNGGTFQTNWQTVDTGIVTNTLQPTIGANVPRSSSGWGLDLTSSEYAGGNFTKQDQISALYLMTKLDARIRGIRVRGHVGIRREDTDVTVNSLDRSVTAVVNPDKTQTTTSTFRTNSRKYKYSNNLPSMLLAADLTDKLVVRYGAYKTFVRPNPVDNVPISTQVSEDALAGGYSVTLGRGGIQPYTSTSQDLSFEYYNRPNGLIGLALYQKEIKGLIVAETRDSVLCPADGYNLGLGHWSIVGDRCVSDIPATGATGTRALNGYYTIDVSGALNSPNRLVVQGAELTVQQAFDFLPAPFKGLGGVFNFSYTRTRGQNVDGTPAYLNNVSPRSANFILYYETKDWGVRGVYNYRDDYTLPGGTTFSGGARAVKARGQLDLSASYQLTERLKLSVDAFNLTDSFYEEYEGSEAKFRRASYDGRTLQATVRYSF